MFALTLTKNPETNFLSLALDSVTQHLAPAQRNARALLSHWLPESRAQTLRRFLSARRRSFDVAMERIASERASRTKQTSSDVTCGSEVTTGRADNVDGCARDTPTVVIMKYVLNENRRNLSGFFGDFPSFLSVI